jgi:phosphoglycerate dehydrogenase-like enzyme
MPIVMLIPMNTAKSAMKTATWRIEHSPTRIAIGRSDRSDPLIVQSAEAGKRPFLHPLRSKSGAILTENAPGHHPWQHGLYVGLNDVNGIGFWTEGLNAASAKNDGSFAPEALAAPVISGNSCAWTVRTRWLAPDGSLILIEEQRWTLAWRQDEWVLDLDWNLSAHADVRFGKSQYGGLFLRMPVTSANEPIALTSAGLALPKEADQKPADWVAVAIRHGDQHEGLVIEALPGNPIEPMPWRVDGQFGIGPARCIAGEWKLGANQTTRERYRITPFAGKPTMEAVTNLLQQEKAMKSAIVVGNWFDGVWPCAADHLQEAWKKSGSRLVRLGPKDDRNVGDAIGDGKGIERLAVFGVKLTVACLAKLPDLRAVGLEKAPDEALAAALKERNIAAHWRRSEGFWGQSVAECAFGLTLCALRQIPQLHHQIQTDQNPWNFDPVNKVGNPGRRGQQYGDDWRFTNGTLCGKRVRVVGMGNIGSRFASWCAAFGADVAAWDAHQPEPVFHRSRVRREWDMKKLFADAEIFVPMLPLMDATKGIVTAEMINALPRGCLVVLVTRAAIVDMAALRKRVLADELSLAADVFDYEPLKLDDPILGRHNVVHTPHIAGRTTHANACYAEACVEPFLAEGERLAAASW